MRLTRLTDYAVTVAVELARDPGRCRNAEDLAQATHLPAPTVAKILKAFRQAKLVQAVRGRHGGYQLHRAANACSLLDIMQALDGPFALTDCGLGNRLCERQDVCHTRHPVQTVQRWLVTHLTHLTLDDFLHPVTHPDALQARLHERWTRPPVDGATV